MDSSKMFFQLYTSDMLNVYFLIYFYERINILLIKFRRTHTPNAILIKN